MNKFLRCFLRIQKERVLAQRSAVCPRTMQSVTAAGALTRTEVIRHLLSEMPVLSNGERSVVSAIHTDRPKQRMTAVGSQSLVCQVLNIP